MKSFVYILTNKNNSVLYTGVTSDLKERIEQHKLKNHRDSFTARYSLFKLVYYEWFDTIGEAIIKEKKIKGGSRKKKIDLINSMNPDWKDLTILHVPSLRGGLRK
jgi:putative endonuclease